MNRDLKQESNTYFWMLCEMWYKHNLDEIFQGRKNEANQLIKDPVFMDVFYNDAIKYSKDKYPILWETKKSLKGISLKFVDFDNMVKKLKGKHERTYLMGDYKW
ncbi:TPA: hypothetical protein ACLMQK_004225 [Yersinia enterocolitica]|uniref:hypothetical protein n=1 Tax=Yersinia TaxID=629 RepID=UPI0005E7221E|nr:MULTISPECIES: hypothetical protein [Yersinia]EKN6007622.1 hypothetical protein [Yersinia enterocolitica]CFR13149.1 Uncharacterised protein [Yersinia kristensenii]HEN3495170.1 hypothetical protein [Yersinia enterocolitica]